MSTFTTPYPSSPLLLSLFFQTIPVGRGSSRRRATPGVAARARRRRGGEVSDRARTRRLFICTRGPRERAPPGRGRWASVWRGGGGLGSATSRGIDRIKLDLSEINTKEGRGGGGEEEQTHTQSARSRMSRPRRKKNISWKAKLELFFFFFPPPSLLSFCIYIPNGKDNGGFFFFFQASERGVPIPRNKIDLKKEKGAPSDRACRVSQQPNPFSFGTSVSILPRSEPSRSKPRR